MTKIEKLSPIKAKKSYKEGHVAVSIITKYQGYDGQRIKIDASLNITISHARELAKTLLLLVAKEEDKLEAKAKSQQHRQEYIKREVSAGRMVLF